MATNTLHASGTETSSGNGSLVNLSENTLVGMFTSVTASSGVLPTLTIKLQQTPNGTDWYDVSSFTTNALGTASLSSLAPSINGQKIADQVRCSWTMGGVNPSFTFVTELVTVP